MIAAQRLEEYVVVFRHRWKPSDLVLMLDEEAAFGSVARSSAKGSSESLVRRMTQSYSFGAQLME